MKLSFYNLVKYLDRYLKLRTVRILREKHITEFTCIAVDDVSPAYAPWYRMQVHDYANSNHVSWLTPFYELAILKNSTVVEERLKFLNHLERLVLEWNDET